MENIRSGSSGSGLKSQLSSGEDLRLQVRNAFVDCLECVLDGVEELRSKFTS